MRLKTEGEGLWLKREEFSGAFATLARPAQDGPDTVENLVREVERRVLARAVRWHLKEWVLMDGNRTVVFE